MKAKDAKKRKPTAEDVRRLDNTGRPPFTARFETMRWNKEDNAWEVSVTYWDRPLERFRSLLLWDKRWGWYIYD